MLLNNEEETKKQTLGNVMKPNKNVAWWRSYSPDIGLASEWLWWGVWRAPLLLILRTHFFSNDSAKYVFLGACFLHRLRG